ncbi:hypothetical protein PTKIN_Ptkin05aG0188400 [Pterospermum kingtungense]
MDAAFYDFDIREGGELWNMVKFQMTMKVKLKTTIVPRVDFVVAMSLLRDERHMNRSKFLIVVTCKAIMRMDDDDEIEEEEEDDYYDDDMDVETLLVELVNEQKGFVGASKSAIEGLEKVSGMGSGECAICLQRKEKEEEEAKRMPCGLVYHGDCIVHWLEKSRLCPLCRFANLTA